MNEKILKNYAKLIARSGINPMPGQEVIIIAEPDQPDFVKMLVEEFYIAGAGKVTVNWRFQPLTALDVKYQSEETLGRVEKWEEERLRMRTEKLPAIVYLHSEDPDGLGGIDQDKWARARQAENKVTKPYFDAMENKYQWCVAAVPGLAWARKVFPDAASDAEAIEKLWQMILRCSRADGADPIEVWKEHSENLRRRCQWLNSLNLRRLIYKSESSGTDFSVGLMPQMQFCGGAEELPGKDLWYNPNIPSEEVFTTPMRGDAEGIVYSTMPLSYRGVLIEDFSVRFEKGRAVEVHARKNEEALKLMIAMDDGASMLGECALVPWKSPIRESGVLFYNTLFDENASCHLALGAGYSSCLENFWEYSQEQAHELGVNDSMIHEDFMIGAPDLSIIGITESGEQVQIFKDGGWAE